ncbi:Transamidase GatB domain protein [hydrothermal vent metagenome]|uniref:Transamidase GatB domain protein n=1 Tax=hydrothermal vent metagenome TaxID=652676 RepID=A0A3B0TVA1_9ZZZZ
MRDRIEDNLKDALRARDKLRTGTLRLIMAAVKDRDIDARGKGKEQISDADIMALLQKMIKQREESAKIYDEAGRDELAETERAEIVIIDEFLPQPMGEEAVLAAIEEAIEETEASSLRDMGKVVGVLKAKFPGQIDFGKASKLVKEKLVK